MYVINSKEREKHDGFCSPDKSQIPRLGILENYWVNGKEILEMQPGTQSFYLILKGLPTSFSLVTSTNVEISPQNFL